MLASWLNFSLIWLQSMVLPRLRLEIYDHTLRNPNWCQIWRHLVFWDMLWKWCRVRRRLIFWGLQNHPVVIMLNFIRMLWKIAPHHTVFGLENRNSSRLWWLAVEVHGRKMKKCRAKRRTVWSCLTFLSVWHASTKLEILIRWYKLNNIHPSINF